MVFSYDFEYDLSYSHLINYLHEERRTSTGVEFLCSWKRFYPNFGQIVSIRVKTLNNNGVMVYNDGVKIY